MKKTKTLIISALALAGLAPVASQAAVSPYSWIRAGESGSVFADASGNNHPFNAAFSSLGGGNPAAVIVSSPTAGGPLGSTGTNSTASTRWGYFNTANSGMWIQSASGGVPTADQWSLPATNWVVEAWVMPVGTGATLDRTDAQFLSTGSGQFGGRPGGIAFRTRHNPDDDTVVVRLDAIGPSATDNFQVGDTAVLPRTRWTHVAAVNDNGVTTFYVNGVANGAPANNVSAPSGAPYIGSGTDTGQPFNGYLDEIRFSTFAPGAFAVSDLLLLPAGPNIVSQPKSISVWNGGVAIFDVLAPADDRTTYQWKLGGADITGATSPELYLANVATADDGKVYSVLLRNSGTEKLSDNATLTVRPVETENNNFFRESISSEASLIAYFPIDADTSTTVSNIEDPAHNGAIEGAVDYDGRTDRAYGVRALRFKANGDVAVTANPAFEFSDGTGTIEALIYLDKGALDPGPQNIFAVAAGNTMSRYQFQVSPDGNSLLLRSDAITTPVTWVVTPSLLNRFAHVALVFEGANVTAYADGISLGTKPNGGLGTSGWGAYIGSAGPDEEGNPSGAFYGTIDELAIYGDALSATTIAIHNSRFLYGTAVTAPTIETAPTGVWNLLAGGAPEFRVTAGGTAPLSYQWKRNGVAIQGNPTAATSTLRLLNSTVDSSGEYSVTVSNPIGETNSASFTVNFAAPPAGDKYASFVLSDHPSAYWRLSETNGTTLIDYAGGLNGTYASTVELGAPGAPGLGSDKAAHFPGGGSPVGNATVPYTPTLNPTGPYTIEFWAKPDQSGNVGRAVVGNQNRNTGRAGYAVYQGFNVNAWEAHLGFNDTVIFVQGTTPAEAGRWDHVVVTWDGLNHSKLYVNGRLEADVEGGPTRPNLSVPLEIGSRFGGAVAYPGTIDEVAFYNHALTLEDVTNHFSVAWVPAAVTTQPPASTGTEAGNVTISAAVSGYPNEYTWSKDGVPLDPATQNPDTSPKYQGINSANLTITQLMLEDAGQYSLAVKNPLGDLTTSAATLTVNRDTVPPAVTYVTSTATRDRVRVVFSKPVTPETAGVAQNYTLNGGITVSSVTLTSDPQVVDVVTSALLTPGNSYTLSVTGVRDTRLNANVIQANSTSFKAFTQRDGVLALDLYRGINGTSVDDLRNDAQYPYGVWTNFSLTNFSVENLGENYGARVYGWIKPTENGNYTFFLRSDDASELYLSTDATPEKVELIAFESACCEGFKEPGEGVDETSAPRALSAGQSYYVEAFLKEGGGGDFIQVAWRKEGDSTAAGNLTPIPGAFLSGYAPEPTATPASLAIAQGANGTLSITWSGTGRLQESADLQSWSDVAGNPASGVGVTPAPGTHKFYRLAQ